jgi:hypothetical protein
LDDEGIQLDSAQHVEGSVLEGGQKEIRGMILAEV